ncbi:hypothetical protein DRJ12_05095 [Candidatus Acetothermia bacterium]|nr:MAG: hypothetical protein DRJ12_05095 [Candidatus Acetothermia bacterium]
MGVFEAIMLVCFGLSWPVSIAKAVRTKNVSGKSPWFMGLIALGYASGIVHKLIRDPNWVVFLYAINLMLVLTDLCLYIRYSGRLTSPGDSV